MTKEKSEWLWKSLENQGKNVEIVEVWKGVKKSPFSSPSKMIEQTKKKALNIVTLVALIYQKQKWK